MRVFVTGGTGFVGTSVLQALVQAGHEPVALVRTPAKLRINGVTAVRGDVLEPDSIRTGMAGCDAVIHLVGIIREFPRKGITFGRLHVEATKNVVQAAKELGVSRIVHMSANGTRPNAVSLYHRTKFEAEEHVRASGIPYVIIRPSLIYGRQDAFVNMLASVLKKSPLPLFPVFGSGYYRLAPVSVGTVAQAFVRSLAVEGITGKEYPLCGKVNLTYRELVSHIGQAVGKKPVIFSVPERLVWIAIKLFSRFALFPITADQFTMLLEENICTDDSLSRMLDLPATDVCADIRQYL